MVACLSPSRRLQRTGRQAWHSRAAAHLRSCAGKSSETPVLQSALELTARELTQTAAKSCREEWHSGIVAYLYLWMESYYSGLVVLRFARELTGAVAAAEIDFEAELSKVVGYFQLCFAGPCLEPELAKSARGLIGSAAEMEFAAKPHKPSGLWRTTAVMP